MCSQEMFATILAIMQLVQRAAFIFTFESERFTRIVRLLGAE